MVVCESSDGGPKGDAEQVALSLVASCVALPIDGKARSMICRSSSVSYERKRPDTARLTYTMAWQERVLPSEVRPLSVAKNAPSIGIVDELAALRFNATGDSNERGKPAASKSFRDQRLD